MSVPWEALVQMVGGSAFVALLLILGGYLAKSIFDRGIARSSEIHQSLLAQSAEAQKIALAQASAFDTDLRRRRIPEYRKLWTLTGRLPKWPRAENLAGHDLRTLSGELREWYFGGGGMLLSAESYDAYRNLQDRLADYLGANADLTQPLGGDEYELIRKHCSALRRELAADIVSRVHRREFSLPT
jgi:hypothetical protein